MQCLDREDYRRPCLLKGRSVQLTRRHAQHRLRDQTGTGICLAPVEHSSTGDGHLVEPDAAVAFGSDGYYWDPSQTTLGAAIPNGIDVIATDGRGAFVGAHQVYLDDGEPGPLQVVAVPSTGAAPSVVTENPFTTAGGYVPGVEAWPHP